jgi:hypothetical protein
MERKVAQIKLSEFSPRPRLFTFKKSCGRANLLGRQIYLAQGADNSLAAAVRRIYSV